MKLATLLLESLGTAAQSERCQKMVVGLKADSLQASDRNAEARILIKMCFATFV